MRLISSVIAFCPSAPVAACGSDDDKFTDCRLGELSGVWTESYRELDGTCGPIPSGSHVQGAPDDSACTIAHRSISEDKCEGEADVTCPTTDGKGTARWVAVIRHVAPGRTRGTGTLHLNHADIGTCRSTYEITSVKQ